MLPLILRQFHCVAQHALSLRFSCLNLPSPGITRYTKPDLHGKVFNFFKLKKIFYLLIKVRVLCSPGTHTQKPACLCLPSADIKGVRHQAWQNFFFLPRNLFMDRVLRTWQRLPSLRSDPLLVLSMHPNPSTHRPCPSSGTQTCMPQLSPSCSQSSFQSNFLVAKAGAFVIWSH